MSASEMSEPSPPVSATLIEDASDFQWNGLSLEGPPFGLEKIFDYETGGHHPVHLGDHLGKGRYHVIHKLGSGGSANVWFCRDLESLGTLGTTKFVALKILMADASKDDCPERQVNKKLGDLRSTLDREVGAKYICLPLDQFGINGPNGFHLCFIYPVLGPRVSSFVSHAFKDPDKIWRNICLETVQAIDFLHSQGICHGDLTPSNILFQISGLNGLSGDELLHRIGKPQQTRVLTQSGESPDKPTAPKYLVYSMDWSSIDPQFVSDQPLITDCGESFGDTNPPEDLGIPGPYRSPELILDKMVGLGCDLWALGCTLFEIRTGRTLFSPFDDDPDGYLDEMVRVLGKLPEPWWSTTWAIRKEWYQDDADSQGRVIHTQRPQNPIEVQQVRKEYISVSTVHPSVAEGARSLQEKLAPGVWYLDGPVDIHREISAKEIEIFADLLSKLLRFDPKDRLTAIAIQDHEWFRT